MATMKAVRIISKGHAAVVNDAPIPTLPSDEVLLVKTVAVALNPTDWKHIDTVTKAQPIVGCDFAGVVEQVGVKSKGQFKKGDRVLSFVHGSNSYNPGNGAFAEYVVTKGPSTLHIPDYLSFEEAAGLGVAIVTVGQGMYQQMPTPWPNQPLKEKVPMLIWGGSSAMGAIGIQFAKLSGFEVITACGKHNFDYVKSLGADVVFDSRSPTAGADIRAYTDNKLYRVWDCIGELGSTEACFEALASAAPKGQTLRYGTVLFPLEKYPRDDVVTSWSLGYSASGEAFEMEMAGKVFEAQPGDYEFIKKWIVVVDGLLKEKKIKPHRLDVREGGLEGILQGLDDFRAGKVSGVKLVYRVAEP